MTREQEYMYIIEYSNDPDKRAAAARKLSEMRNRKFTMDTLYASNKYKADTNVDILDEIKAF